MNISIMNMSIMDRVKQLKSKPGLRVGVTSKCIECTYNEGSGIFRRDIEECMSVRCPLYDVRPVSSAQKYITISTQFYGVDGTVVTGAQVMELIDQINNEHEDNAD